MASLILNRHRVNRRRMFLLLGTAAALMAGWPRALMAETLGFDELYEKSSPLGLTFSEKIRRLHGKNVEMRGFMAPPLKAEAMFFVLTCVPMSICPFCSSDADWPDDIVVVYLERKQTFVQSSRMIAVSGILDTGSRTDEETGFISQLRLLNARYYRV